MLRGVVASTVVASAVVAVAAAAVQGSTHAYQSLLVGPLSAGHKGAAAPAALFVSTTGSDQGTCSKASPCRSLGRAYRAARPGQVVEVAGGSYPSQAISSDGSKSSSDVVFRPAAGASVRIGAGTTGLDVRASHVTVTGFDLDWWSVSGADVTMRRIDGRSFYIDGRDVLVDGGDYGPYEPPCQPGSQYPEHDNPTVSTSAGGIVIRGAVFHDMTNRNCVASHMDCLQVAQVNGLVVEGNKFRGCFSNDLILTGDFGAMTNITLQNNWFGPTKVGYYGLNWNPKKDCPGAVVRFNTFIGPDGVRLECSHDKSMQMYGNIVPTIDARRCGSWDATQHHNVADTGQAVAACGAGSHVARDRRVDFVDRAGGDYHLAPGSEAIGRAETGPPLRSDIDGQARPFRVRADAGADQREPAALVLGRRIGMVELGMIRSQVERLYGIQRVRFTRARPRHVGIASYTRAGGRISVNYAGGRVVGVATASPYYSTPSGLGVGAAFTGHGRWSSCSKAYRRSLGPVTLDFRPAGGKGGKRIARIGMTRRAYAVC